MDSITRKKIKTEIQNNLNDQPKLIADSARYFADRIIECKGKTISDSDLSMLAVDSILRAIRDSGYGPEEAAVLLPRMVNEHGNTIANLAVSMATYMTHRSKTPWKPAAIVAGLGVAVAMILGA